MQVVLQVKIDLEGAQCGRRPTRCWRGQQQPYSKRKAHAQITRQVVGVDKSAGY